jgi:hypothetical protein
VLPEGIVDYSQVKGLIFQPKIEIEFCPGLANVESLSHYLVNEITRTTNEKFKKENFRKGTFFSIKRAYVTVKLEGL